MKYILLFISMLLTTIIFNSCITACDCVGTESMYVKFYDAQTGNPVSLTGDSTAHVEILDEPENSFQLEQGDSGISMILDTDYSNLCSDQQVKFNVYFQNQIVESVTADFTNDRPNCDCYDICMLLTRVQQDSMNITNALTGTTFPSTEIRIEL